MPTYTSTVKYALRWLTGANNVSDVDAGFQALAEDVDASMAGFASGTFATRPAPGKPGRIYLATDTGRAYLDTGGAWVEFTLGGDASSVPTATVLAFAASTVPAGYLLCDGTAVSRSTYATLFAAIGTAHGAGNGSTTFNVPDLRGRVPVGVDGSAGRLASNDALGQSGGEEKHTMTVAESAPHSHGGTTLGPNQSQAHRHALGGWAVAASETWSYLGAQSGFSESVIVPSTSHAIITETSDAAPANHDHTFTTSTVGSGNPHNNMPPYQILNYIIRT
jgi:microcystin-dependent protein